MSLSKITGVLTSGDGKISLPVESAWIFLISWPVSTSTKYSVRPMSFQQRTSLRCESVAVAAPSCGANVLYAVEPESRIEGLDVPFVQSLETPETPS